MPKTNFEGLVKNLFVRSFARSTVGGDFDFTINQIHILGMNERTKGRKKERKKERHDSSLLKIFAKICF